MLNSFGPEDASVPSRHGTQGRMKDAKLVKGPSLKFYKWGFQTLSLHPKREEKKLTLSLRMARWSSTRLKRCPCIPNMFNRKNEVTMERGRANRLLASRSKFLDT